MVVPHVRKAALVGVTSSRDEDLPVQNGCSVAADSSVQRVSRPAWEETAEVLHQSKMIYDAYFFYHIVLILYLQVFSSGV